MRFQRAAMLLALFLSFGLATGASAQEAKITLREGMARAQETEFVRFSRRAEALGEELGISV